AVSIPRRSVIRWINPAESFGAAAKERRNKLISSRCRCRKRSVCFFALWRRRQRAKKQTDLFLHLHRVILLPVDSSIDYFFDPTQQRIENQNHKYRKEQGHQGIISVNSHPRT